jgi:RNA polymerase sigma-70 factor, ECF subfamily
MTAAGGDMTNSATAELQLDANDFDVELMLRSKAGDDAAFSELFERYAKRLVGFAYRMVRDRWRAEELVQDAFLQIYRARDRYSPSARFSTYIYRVVTNNCLNEIRRLGHEKTVPGEARPLADETTPGPDHLIMHREILSRVADAVLDLPSQQRAALLLSRLEGFDQREVASCLGVSEFAVKSLVFRATRTLREGIQEQAGEPSAKRRPGVALVADLNPRRGTSRSAGPPKTGSLPGLRSASPPRLAERRADR